MLLNEYICVLNTINSVSNGEFQETSHFLFGGGVCVLGGGDL